jgi:hypothetical protein
MGVSILLIAQIKLQISNILSILKRSCDSLHLYRLVLLLPLAVFLDLIDYLQVLLAIEKNGEVDVNLHQLVDEVPAIVDYP